MKYLFFTFILLNFNFSYAEPNEPKQGQSISKQESIKDLCEKSGLSDGSFNKEHKLKNGTTLYLCGYGKNPHVREVGIWIARPNQKAKESDLHFGSYTEAYAPFGTQPVKIDFTTTGMIITDHIPLDAHNFVPTVKSIIHCKDDCVKEKKVKCIFSKIKRDLTKSKEEKTILKIVKSKEQIPTDEQLMVLYRSALAGNKSALKALLDENFLNKMDKSVIGVPGEPGGFAHNCIEGVLSNLKKLKCL